MSGTPGGSLPPLPYPSRAPAPVTDSPSAVDLSRQALRDNPFEGSDFLAAEAAADASDAAAQQQYHGHPQHHHAHGHYPHHGYRSSSSRTQHAPHYNGSPIPHAMPQQSPQQPQQMVGPPYGNGNGAGYAAQGPRAAPSGPANGVPYAQPDYAGAVPHTATYPAAPDAYASYRIQAPPPPASAPIPRNSTPSGAAAYPPAAPYGSQSPWQPKAPSSSTLAAGLTPVLSRVSEVRAQSSGGSPSPSGAASAAGDAHPLAQPAPSSAPQTPPASTSGGKRKRTRQFKYLTDEPASKDADGTLSGGEDASMDQSGASAGEGGKPASRKKVKRACLFCKRSHMPCEVARPCARCTKRGIAHLCKDDPANAAADTSADTSTVSEQGARAAAKGKGRRGGAPRAGAAQQRKRTAAGAASAGASNAGSDADGAPATRGRANEEVELLARMKQGEASSRPQLPISLLLSDNHSAPNSSGSSRGAQAGGRPRRGAAPNAAAEDASSSSDRPAEASASTAGGNGGPRTRAQTDAAADATMDEKDQEELERLLEGGDQVFDLKDAFADKPIGLLSNSLGVSADHTLAAMLPWKPARPERMTRNASKEPAGPNGSADLSRRPSKASTSASASGAGDADADAVDEAARNNIFLREEVLTAAALRGIPSYSHAFGYAKLAHWMNTRFSPDSCASIERALGSVRPKFLEMSRELSPSQLLDIEEEIHSTIDHYRKHVFESVPFAMLLVRRTGEIYGGNSHASKWLQLPQDLFSNGKLFHFQLLKEQDAVTVIDMYAQECLKPRSENQKEPESGAEVAQTIEIDRSLLLHDKAALDPRSGQLLEGASETLEDGSPSVLRVRAQLVMQAKMSKHGLPLVVCLYMRPLSE